MRVGVWLIGALGDVATTTILGARAVARGLAETTGLVTARAPYNQLPLASLDELVFAGHDVREGDLLKNAQSLAEAGVVPAHLVSQLSSELEAVQQRIKPGVALGCAEAIATRESSASQKLRSAGPQAAVAAIRADLRAFKEAEELERVVVVAVASTEPRGEAPPLTTADEVLERVAAHDASLPASVLYALAAFQEGCPYVNFTPSWGSASPGMQELAEREGVPHMGQDGKTGETLLRTALAPVFRDRNLQVLSWSGFNILGNRDGEVLDEPAANQAKTQGKDKVLGSILGDQLGSSLTRIDYVPSLQDWKTAWDHVHFQGFLGTKMHLEFTWRGADSALAAPLVLDLVRLIELAARQGRSGLQTGLACFFKAPLSVVEQDFAAQMQLLGEYAQELAQHPRDAPVAPTL